MFSQVQIYFVYLCQNRNESFYFIFTIRYYWVKKTKNITKRLLNEILCPLKKKDFMYYLKSHLRKIYYKSLFEEGKGI